MRSYMRPRKTKSDILVDLFVDVVLVMLAGWQLMFAVAVIHDHWIRSCPTIGFGWAALLAMLIRGALYRRNSDDES